MKRTSTHKSLVAVSMLLAVASISPAAVIFSNIADTTTIAPGHGAFTSFDSYPSVSGSNVAFVGSYSGGTGLYTGSVGTTGAAKIADVGDIAPRHGTFTDFVNPSVSGSKLVFLGIYAGGAGIYTGSVGVTGFAKVVDHDDSAPGHGAFTSVGNPAVNGSNLAFSASYSGGRGIYTGTVGTTGSTKVVDLDDIAPGHGVFTIFGSFASVSGSNVAFYGGYSGGRGIYTGTVGTTGSAKVADSDDSAPGHGAFTDFDDPAISGSNLVFEGTYSGGQGIYTGSVGTTGFEKVVDSGATAPGHGVFTSFSNASISGSDVALLGTNTGGNSGIYLAKGGAGGSLSAVVNMGDSLFGSKVQTLAMGKYALDNNAIAFQYTLTNGRRGIAVASVPEPASPALLVLGGLLFRRRRHPSAN